MSNRSIVALLLAALLLAGCTTIKITADNGATVTVNASKTVTVTTEATIPAAALGL